MIRILAILFVFIATAAVAQEPPVIMPPNTVYGRLQGNGLPGPGQAIPISSLPTGGGGGGSGTVNTGSAGQVAFYAANGTAVSGGAFPSIASTFNYFTAGTNIGITCATSCQFSVTGPPSAASLTANAPVIGNGTGPVGVGAKSGNTNTFATSNGTLNNGHCVSIDVNGNFVDAGGACTTSGGGGTVSSGTAGQLAVYAASGATVSGANSATLAQGGLGASQAGATANQIPVFPGSGGAASPTSLNTLLYNVVCNTSSCPATIVPSVAWFGCFGDGHTDVTIACQNAETAAALATGSGAIYWPSGTYCVSGTITLGNVLNKGANQYSTIVDNCAGVSDFSVFKNPSTSIFGSLENIRVQGLCTNTGATKPAVEIDGSGFYFEHVTVYCGNPPVYFTGSDSIAFDLHAAYGYGTASILSDGTTGAGATGFFVFRSSVDQNPPDGTNLLSGSASVPAWTVSQPGATYDPAHTRLTTMTSQKWLVEAFYGVQSAALVSGGTGGTPSTTCTVTGSGAGHSIGAGGEFQLQVTTNSSGVVTAITGTGNTLQANGSPGTYNAQPVNPVAVTGCGFPATVGGSNPTFNLTWLNGASGTSQPTVKPYPQFGGSVIMVDNAGLSGVNGTVWLLVAPFTYYGYQCKGCNVNYVQWTDVSCVCFAGFETDGAAAGFDVYANTIQVNVVAVLFSAGTNNRAADNTLSPVLTGGQGAQCGAGATECQFYNNECINITGICYYLVGGFGDIISGGYAIGSTDGVLVGANVSYFSITNIIAGTNTLVSGTAVNVLSGTSDHYIINNILCGGSSSCITDGGSGIHKIVQSNTNSP